MKIRYMKIQNIISIIIVAIMAISCGKENPVIDNSDNTFLILAAKSGAGKQLALIEQPSGKVINENILVDLPDSAKISSNISRLAAYGSSIYVLIPDDYRILIYNRWNYKYINSISFAEEKLKPIDIAFANSTDAYLIFDRHNEVALLDLKFHKISKKIEVGEATSSIAYNNSKILVSNAKSNTVSVINAATYKKESDFAVSKSPIKILVSSNYPTGAVICGKPAYMDSTASDIPAAALSIIDLANFSVRKEYEIKTLKVPANKIFPSGAALGDNNMLYIASQQGIFKSNIRMLSTPLQSIKYAVMGISSNAIGDQILIMPRDGKSLMLSSANGEPILDLNIPKDLITFLIL